jgi:hypothetical protein
MQCKNDGKIGMRSKVLGSSLTVVLKSFVLFFDIHTEFCERDDFSDTSSQKFSSM